MLPSYKIPQNFRSRRALAIDTIYFSLKSREKRKIFCLRLWRAEKWSILGTARQKKRVNFLMCWWFCPPLEKFLRAPMALALYWRSAPDKARADLLPGAASLTRVAP